MPVPLARQRDDDLASPGWGRWWLAGCLVLACLLGARAWYPAAAPAVPLPRSSQATTSSQRIDTVRVGQRVVAENPDPASSARSDETPIDPVTWRFLRLRADYRWSDGTIDPIDVETLQSPEWVAEHAAQVGARVPLPLDLVELGLPDDLQATVLANEPCPAIPAGPGSVVQSTVTHLNPTVYELTLQDGQGHRQSVRPTGLHRLYSEDRQAWLSTENLQEGEHLRGLSGSLTLVHRERVPGIHRVYNMTVHGEHVFHVSSLGLLSHNVLGNCGTGASGLPSDVKNTLDRIDAGVKFPHRNDGTIFRNREGLLPTQPSGYYTEYVHPTPGVTGPGAQRVVIGKGGERYFTPDHYRTFIPIPPQD